MPKECKPDDCDLYEAMAEATYALEAKIATMRESRFPKELALAIPKADTHPGTGLEHLNGKVSEPDPKSLLGEDD